MIPPFPAVDVTVETQALVPLRDAGLVVGENARLEVMLKSSRRLDTLSRGSGRWMTIRGEYRQVARSPTILLCEFCSLLLTVSGFGTTVRLVKKETASLAFTQYIIFSTILDNLKVTFVSRLKSCIGIHDGTLLLLNDVG